jgi:hypothetical protein
MTSSAGGMRALESLAVSEIAGAAGLLLGDVNGRAPIKAVYTVLNPGDYLGHRVRRCSDCDLNGYVDSVGKVRPKYRGKVRRCGTCGGTGQIRLVTKRELQRSPKTFLPMLAAGSARIASTREVVDPMLLYGASARDGWLG